MLKLYSNELVYFLPFILAFSFSWGFFLKNNFLYNRVNENANDVIYSTSLKKIDLKLFINYICVVLVLILTFVLTLRGSSLLLWWNHLYINSLNILLILIIIACSIFTLIFIKDLHLNNNINNNDYYFSLVNLVILIPLIFLSFSLYNFFFVLEVISTLIFYKFSVSKFWYKNINDNFNKKNILERFISRNFINVLFYQYWVNFFSSTIIIFSIINLIYVYGSSEWVFLNFIQHINTNIFYFTKTFNYIFWIPFFVGFFLKIGLSPVHLFKIEIYKGIPFISIYFYTTFYFFSYFLFFVTFLYFYLNSFKIFWWLFMTIMFIFGIIYIIALLFDTNFTKAFFAYSTIANSLSFLTLILVNL